VRIFQLDTPDAAEVIARRIELAPSFRYNIPHAPRTHTPANPMRTLTLFALLGLAPLTFAQDAKDVPLDTSYLKDHALTRGFMLGRPVRPKVAPDGKTVLFLRAKARQAKMSLYEFDVGSGKTKELLTPEALLKGAEEHLTAEEKARRERQRVTVGGFTNFHLSPSGDRVLVSLSGKLYVFERGGKATELKTGKGTLVDPKFSPDGKLVSYVLDHDVYVIDLAGQKQTRVTRGGTAKKTNGLAEFVAQEEMHRFTGYWWSPDSKSIAYQESDAKDVEVWYVADPVSPEQEGHPSYYPRPGKANVKVRLGVVPVAGGETAWVEWDSKKYEYLGRVDWQKEALTLVVQDRKQQEQALLKADPTTGKTAALLTERDPAWVNLNHDKPHFLDDGSFLWHGEGKGGAELQHRDKTGELRRVLVPASDGFAGIVHADKKTKEVVYSGSADPTETHLFRKPIDGGKAVPLTTEPGLHSAVVGKTGVYVVTSSLLSVMPVSVVYKADGTKVAELPSVAEQPPFVVKQQIVKVGKSPGFHATVIRPRKFDDKKKYPVIVHVYGGPGHQEVQKQMTRRLIDQWLADQGFVVVAIDNRGTPGRGRDWERAVYRKFGSVPLEDQVAGAPVTDWYDYDTHYTERYMSVPQKDDEAYKDGSLLTFAKDLKRPLLLIHGTADDNVYFRHSLRLANALFREGRDFDLLPLSGTTHLTPDPVVTQRLYGRFAGYFRKHLGKPNTVKEKE
jgi:dipeptidyl-peptidase-4